MVQAGSSIAQGLSPAWVQAPLLHSDTDDTYGQSSWGGSFAFFCFYSESFYTFMCLKLAAWQLDLQSPARDHFLVQQNVWVWQGDIPLWVQSRVHAKPTWRALFANGIVTPFLAIVLPHCTWSCMKTGVIWPFWAGGQIGNRRFGRLLKIGPSMGGWGQMNNWK